MKIKALGSYKFPPKDSHILAKLSQLIAGQGYDFKDIKNIFVGPLLYQGWELDAEFYVVCPFKNAAFLILSDHERLYVDGTNQVETLIKKVEEYEQAKLSIEEAIKILKNGASNG